MGENPFGGKVTTTIEQQGHDRHQACCCQARQHKTMEVMRNANNGLGQERARQDLERVRRAFGPAAAASLFEHHDLPASGATDESTKRSNVCYDNDASIR